MVLAHFAALDLTREALIKLASDAEWYVGTRGGIMDQYASLFAERNHALFLDCRPHDDGTYATQVVPLPEDYDIIVAESGVRHDNVRGGYNRRVAACRSGVGLLHGRWPAATHLRDFEAVEWEEMEPLLPVEFTVGDALAAGFDVGDIPGLSAGDILRVRSCCRHVWQENRRVTAAYEALSHGDVVTAGALISTAHASARDNYDISFPEMETLVGAAATVDGVAGGRITGAGWGGCGVFLAQRDATDALRVTLEQVFQDRHGRKPAIFLCQSGSAAGHLATVSV
jgi:galactokinase